jgi:hypothetical protein
MEGRGGGEAQGVADPKKEKKILNCQKNTDYAEPVISFLYTCQNRALWRNLTL